MMKDHPGVSVCMATYNGARYLNQQIESILEQLEDSDELVVVDDASTDESAQIVRSYNDPRVRLVVNDHNVGHVRSFEVGMTFSTGDIVMLSDQDDVWADGRVTCILRALEGGGMIASNFDYLPSAVEGPRLGELPARSSLVVDLVALALGRRPYYGCTMAFTRDFVDLALPFPSGTRAHDHWLAILGLTSRRLRHAPEVTVHRRLHDDNLSPRTRRRLGPVVRTRLLMASHVLAATLRVASSRGRDYRRSSGPSRVERG